jgi:hypothetical protein
LPNQKFKIVGNKIQLEKIGKIAFVQDRDNRYAKIIKTYKSFPFASCFNMLPKLTLSVGVNTPQADTV